MKAFLYVLAGLFVYSAFVLTVVWFACWDIAAINPVTWPPGGRGLFLIFAPLGGLIGYLYCPPEV